MKIYLSQGCYNSSLSKNYKKYWDKFLELYIRGTLTIVIKEKKTTINEMKITMKIS